jgi:putative endonuclease
MKEKLYSVYIMANQHKTTLYTGVTNNLQQRTLQHKSGEGANFTKRYNLTILVYYEITSNVRAAIWREKQIKAGSRQKKIDLIEPINPEWKDLYDEL